MAIETLDHPSSRPTLPGRGSYPIPIITPTTAGFLGRTERGPINEPIVVESFPEYCRYFGGHFADGAVSFAVHDFFLQGGRRAVIVRVANRASRAQIDIPTDGDVLRLQARHPGRHEILRVSVDYEQVENDNSQFNLVVQRLGGTDTGLVEDQELYPLISTRPTDARYIGTVLQHSRLIALGGPPPASRPIATPPNRPGDPVRYINQTRFGDDGDELTDYDIIGSDRDATGLFAFARGPGINLLAIPLPAERELGTTAFVAAARYCEKNRALLVWDPPHSWQSVDSAILGARRLDFTSGNVMTYFSRVRPRGSRARFIGGLPASGAICGMLAQRDRRGLWGDDDNLDYTLRGALTPVVDINGYEAQRLARSGINSFVHAGGGSMRLVGQVTLGAAGLGPSSRSSLSRRRLKFFILDSLKEAAIAAATHPDRNTALLRLEVQTRRFFDDLYLRRALAGKNPGQAFYLHTRISQIGDRATLRFGFALDEAGRFDEYLIDLAGIAPGKLERVRAIEAQQLFS